MKILALINVEQDGLIKTEALGAKEVQEAAYKQVKQALAGEKVDGIHLDECTEVPEYVHVDDLAHTVVMDAAKEAAEEYFDALERLGE